MHRFLSQFITCYLSIFLTHLYHCFLSFLHPAWSSSHSLNPQLKSHHTLFQYLDSPQHCLVLTPYTATVPVTYCLLLIPYHLQLINAQWSSKVFVATSTDWYYCLLVLQLNSTTAYWYSSLLVLLVIGTTAY